LEKIAEHIGTACGQDISKELQNKTTVIIAEELTHAAAMILQNMA
jgi:hypothetical protein